MPRKPYKFTARKRREFLKLLAEGQRRGAAAEKVGVTRQTPVYAMRADPEFAAAVDEAEMAANELVENALFEAAKEGNVTACQVWLYNRAADRWADMRKMQHSGPEGGPIEQNIRVVEDGDWYQNADRITSEALAASGADTVEPSSVEGNGMRPKVGQNGNGHPGGG